MKQFEYKTIMIHQGGSQQAPLLPPDNKLLDQAGVEGWELVCTTPGIIRVSVLFHFRRELPPPSNKGLKSNAGTKS